MSMHDNQAHQDPRRTIGLPGTPWRATVAIGPDGTETLWLVSPDPGQKPGCACATCAPHEQDTSPSPTQGGDMSLRANLRAVDRTRTTQLLTAWTCEDREAFDQVLAEANDDPGRRPRHPLRRRRVRGLAGPRDPTTPGEPDPDPRDDPS